MNDLYDFILPASEAAAITASARRSVLEDVLRRLSEAITRAAHDGNNSIHIYSGAAYDEDLDAYCDKTLSDAVAILEGRGYRFEVHEGYISWGTPTTTDNGRHTDFLTGSEY